MLGAELDKAAQLLATVAGRDLDSDIDGMFRIARRVAKDRVAIRPVKNGSGVAAFGTPAPAARSLRSAPPRLPAAPSRSAPTSPNSRVLVPPRPTARATPTTLPPDPRWNARSAI